MKTAARSVVLLAFVVPYGVVCTIVQVIVALWRMLLMPARLPSFVNGVNLWRWANWNLGVPPVVAPDATFTAQLRMYRTAFLFPRLTNTVVPMALLCPKGTDIRGRMGWYLNSNTPDLVEVPAGSGRYYTVWAVDDVDKGQPSEYRFCLLQQNTAPLTPLP